MKEISIVGEGARENRGELFCQFNPGRIGFRYNPQDGEARGQSSDRI